MSISQSSNHRRAAAGDHSAPRDGAPKADYANPNGDDDSLRRLIRLIVSLQFGRIEGLSIENGLPVFDPAPIVLREVRFSDGPKEHCRSTERHPVFRELARELRHHARGRIRQIDVRHGLPFRLIMEATDA